MEDTISEKSEVDAKKQLKDSIVYFKNKDNEVIDQSTKNQVLK